MTGPEARSTRVQVEPSDPTRHASPIRLLYVLGTGRNGSTLLGNLLGSVPGVTNIGESYWLWDRLLAENRLCGCGSRGRDCEWWRERLARLAPEGFEPMALARLRDRALGSRLGLPLAFPGGRRARARDSFGRLLASLYRALADSEDAEDGGLIVDTSKWPHYLDTLLGLDALDVRVLHLVRDPRAVAYSMQQRRLNPDRPDGASSSPQMQRHGAARAAAAWSLWNAYGEVIARRLGPRYLRMRYEDFAAAPARAVASILEFAGEAPPLELFTSERDAVVSPSHSVSGNPSRFDLGAVTVRPDEAWRSGLRRRDAWLVQALAGPGLLRYGYLGGAKPSAQVSERR